MKFLSSIRGLLIALWLGAAVYFSFALAPSAFAVLPTRELAGMLVSRSLMILNISGLAIALIALVGSFAGNSGVNKALLWIERVLLALTAAACAVGQFVIAWWLAAVKAQMGRPIDEVAAEDPLRITFNNLHEYSVWVLITAMIASVIAFFIIAGRSHSKPAAPPTAKDLDFMKDFKV
jgi:hypothetical protein